MADSKISALTAKTTMDAADLLPIVDVSDTSQAASGTTKKIIKDNLLTKGTLAANAPENIAQTWNNSGVTFQAVKINVTDTASNIASRLLEGQVGGATAFGFVKSGALTLGGVPVGHGSGALIITDGSSVPQFVAMQNAGGTVVLPNGGSYNFAATGNAYTGTVDTAIKRNAAGVLEVNNGTSGSYRDLILRNLRMAAPTGVPVNASDAGTAGDIKWDANYVYICTAANTWKRAALATW